MAKYPVGLLEEELKNKVAADWFAAYDTTRIIGKVDFCVAIPATELGLFEAESALWAEAKAGIRKDIHESFVQLILTIGRARTFDTERPPRKDYWNYIAKRLDLLVPQDVRERKGAFFTPQKWVELSQEYLAKELGENWQDEYVIWDSCAGTGNMEVGLTNKYNIWASTLDQQDVDVMRGRIRNGANLLDNHVFQFDFLNDSFDKLPNPRGIWVSAENLIPVSVYHSVRHAVEATWMNDRDQYLSPNKGWEADGEFRGDCLLFTLFHSSIRIKSELGVNHWIPFTEEEVGAQDCFDSHFMSDFLKGKANVDAASSPRQMELATSITSGRETASPLTRRDAAFTLSSEAQAVLDAGRELWRYYHKQPKANPNASYYDIRKFFQGVKVDAKGKEKMNAMSGDADYNERLAALKKAMRKLAAKIEPKVYAYGFLKR